MHQFPQPDASSDDCSPFPAPGTDLGVLEVAVSPEANDRYWRGAEIHHALRADGLLYPPMAVNLTILLVQRTVEEGLLHTRESLRCLATALAGQALSVQGCVTDRFEKRGRDYFLVDSTVTASDGTELWRSTAELAASRVRRQIDRPPRDARRAGGDRPEPPSGEHRSLRMTPDLLRAYSRAGNFHSDDRAAQDMGLPGMAAMGMQTVVPAYALVLDSWGRSLLERGVLDATFFGLVLADDTVEATVDRSGDDATFRITNLTRRRDTASGTLRIP